MIKLEKRELEVLEQANDILESLYYNSTEEERKVFDIFATLVNINGITLYQLRTYKEVK